MNTGFGSGNQLERRVTDLERKQRTTGSMAGVVASLGTFTLATGAATSTTVSNANVSPSSLIFYTPADAGGWSADGALNGIAPGSGSFVVSHQASSLTRTYNYVVVNAA